MTSKRQRSSPPGRLHNKKSRVAVAVSDDTDDAEDADYSAPLRHLQRSLLATFYGWHAQPGDGDDGSETAGTISDLTGVLRGSVEHGEGNSVLVVGGRGTGKTLAVRSALAAVPTRRFIPIHLHGSVHTTDKMALREMARQIRAQGGTVTSLDALQLQVDENGEGGESTEHPEHTIDIGQSTLTALLTLLAASALPIVVVLDEFDLFAAHARQALLYCLLDCAQGGRRRGGLAVVGTTCRFVGCLTFSFSFLLIDFCVAHSGRR